MTPAVMLPAHSSKVAAMLATCCCLLLPIMGPAAPQGASLGWQVIHKQTEAAAGGPNQPSIRYGHGTEHYGGAMLMTHGYFYDRDRGVATWLSDTWSMDTGAPHGWQRISTGISQEHAREAYSAGRVPHAPAGRFGHSTVVHNDSLYLYGGHDGGFSRHGRQNYEPGFDFDELWRFSLPTRSWHLVLPSAVPSVATPSGPGKRYLHASAVVGDQLLVYGGLSEGQGDVWAYDLGGQGGWSLLCHEVPRSEGGPGRRVGHTISAVDQPDVRPDARGRTRGFLLLGGRYIEAGGSTALDASLHFFDLGSRAWRVLPVGGGSDGGGGGGDPEPSGRKYHAGASAWLRVAPDGAVLAEGAGSKQRADPGRQRPAGSGSGGGGWSGWLTGAAAGTPPPNEGDRQDYVHVTLVAGGTITTPGLTCTREAWLLALDCGARQALWLRLPDLPTAVYDLRGAVSPASAWAFVYGGHLCSDSKGDLPFFYTNAVAGLDLTQSGIRLPAGACRVGRQGLPRQRGQGEAAMQPEEREL